MVASPHKTCLGLTYFCDEADALGQRDDTHLIRLASQELMELGLIESDGLIESGTVIRQPQAYPIHTTQTLSARAVVQKYLEGFENLQTIGCQGLHRCMRLDGNLVDGQRAAENILNRSSAQRVYAQHDLWKSPSQSPVTAAPITF